MKNSLLSHFRDILILPFTVTCIVPFIIYEPSQQMLPASLYFKVLGAIVILCGLCLFIYTVFLFKKVGKGTIAPWSPKKKLVINGPYRYCRNPMISGVLFILIGEAILLSSTSILIWSAIFFVVNTIYFLISEEPALLAQFGEDYKRYKSHVPRWLPRTKPFTL